MIIDFHNHFYPPEYIAAVKAGPSHYRVTEDKDGNPVLHSPGDANFIVPGHRDIAYRQEVIAKAGVDKQVITLTAPGTDLEEPARAIELAALTNDALAKVVSERGDHFTSLATLPMTTPEAAVKEFQRARHELGFPGAMLFSNVNGTPLADERFWPLYEIASKEQAVLYIHPTYPVGVSAMEEFWLMPLVGFTFDTTLAAAHLVFAGIPERFPGIRWALGHLGGAIPYLAERLDRGYTAFEECRRNIKQPPSHYLKQFYYDTVNFDPAALRLAIEFAGVSQILAGSDYPHLIGSIGHMLTSIRGLGLNADDEAAILGGNSKRLLGM